jgi:hypothetical protein
MAQITGDRGLPRHALRIHQPARGSGGKRIVEIQDLTAIPTLLPPLQDVGAISGHAIFVLIIPERLTR